MKKNHSAALAGVTVYRHLLQLPPLAALTKLFRALEQQDGVTALEGYTETFYALTQEGRTAWPITWWTSSATAFPLTLRRPPMDKLARCSPRRQSGI